LARDSNIQSQPLTFADSLDALPSSIEKCDVVLVESIQVCNKVAKSESTEKRP
jgi:hypothetical protein